MNSERRVQLQNGIYTLTELNELVEVGRETLEERLLRRATEAVGPVKDAGCFGQKIEQVDVLDKGYVRYIDHMGSDLNVVNAARASYAKESLEFNDKDERLLNFLVRENHTAPFRHAILSLEVYAPLFVARQWWKHIIGGTQDEFLAPAWPGLDPFLAWNESSRRYVTETPEFYMARWRGKPDNNKQGSTDFLDNMEYFDHLLESHYEAGLELYNEAMAAGIAPEQARLFLGANGLYVRWRWTSSLQGVQHFIRLRDEEHAQWEIVQFAKGVRQIAAERFPVSIGALPDGA